MHLIVYKMVYSTQISGDSLLSPGRKNKPHLKDVFLLVSEVAYLYRCGGVFTTGKYHIKLILFWFAFFITFLNLGVHSDLNLFSHMKPGTRMQRTV